MNKDFKSIFGRLLETKDQGKDIESIMSDNKELDQNEIDFLNESDEFLVNFHKKYQSLKEAKRGGITRSEWIEEQLENAPAVLKEKLTEAMGTMNEEMFNE